MEFQVWECSSCTIYHDLPFHFQFRRSTRQVIFGENWFTFTFIWTWSGEVHAIIRGRLLPDCTCVILCDLGLVAINWLNLGFKDVASLLRTPLHQSNVCAKNDDYIPCCFCFCCPRGGGWWELVLASGGFSWFKGLTCWEPSCSPGKSQWNPKTIWRYLCTLWVLGYFFVYLQGFYFLDGQTSGCLPLICFEKGILNSKTAACPHGKGKSWLAYVGIVERNGCWMFSPFFESGVFFLICVGFCQGCWGLLRFYWDLFWDLGGFFSFGSAHFLDCGGICLGCCRGCWAFSGVSLGFVEAGNCWHAGFGYWLSVKGHTFLEWQKTKTQMLVENFDKNWLCFIWQATEVSWEPFGIEWVWRGVEPGSMVFA